MKRPKYKLVVHYFLSYRSSFTVRKPTKDSNVIIHKTNQTRQNQRRTVKKNKIKLNETPIIHKTRAEGKSKQENHYNIIRMVMWMINGSLVDDLPDVMMFSIPVNFTEESEGRR